MASLSSIDEFLGRKRFAVVGVSRNPKDFTRTLFRELRDRGYEAIPVNPNLQEIDGAPCFASLRDIQPGVEAALLLTNPSVTEVVVRECAEAGVRQVWMYRAIGSGAVSAAALSFCEAHGIDAVDGECPFMFLPHTGWPHRVHGFCKKLLGRYPA